MVTVFMTDEAEDYLLEEFAENGFPDMPNAEWTSDILLEYVDSGMTVRIFRTEDVEAYMKTTRFFPPTLQEAEIEKPEIDEKALEECRYHLEEYLAGDKAIGGISTDEDLSWLRHSILFRRLVAPRVREHIAGREYTPDDSTSGVFLSCEKGELSDEIVYGEQRPDLTYGQVHPETGEVEIKKGRCYEDEISDGEGFDSVMRDLAKRPKYMMNPDGSGEKADLPAAILRAYQSSRLWLDGKHRRKLLSARTVPVEFKQDGFLLQRNLKQSAERIYISVDTLMKLPEADVPINRLPEEMLPEAVIEITDADYICVAEISGNIRVNTKLSLYTRFGVPLMSPFRAEAGNVGMGSGTFLGDGFIGADGEGYLDDVVYSLLFGYRKILGVMIASDWFSKHGKTEAPQSGLLIETAGDQIVIRRVCGTTRPELICGAGEGQIALWRPYRPDDDLNLPEIIEYVTVDDIAMVSEPPFFCSAGINDVQALEQKTAEGDPRAMKQLAEKYAKGDGVTADPRKALALYEKAYALMPDDNDLEFEIFMLKMDIDNQ